MSVQQSFLLRFDVSLHARTTHTHTLSHQKKKLCRSWALLILKLSCNHLQKSLLFCYSGSPILFFVFTRLMLLKRITQYIQSSIFWCWIYQMPFWSFYVPKWGCSHSCEISGSHKFRCWIYQMLFWSFYGPKRGCSHSCEISGRHKFSTRHPALTPNISAVRLCTERERACKKKRQNRKQVCFFFYYQT